MNRNILFFSLLIFNSLVLEKTLSKELKIEKEFLNFRTGDFRRCFFLYVFRMSKANIE